MIRVFFCTILAIQALRGATISVSPASTSTDPGQAFGLSIRIDSVADLYAYQFDLAFNAAVVRATQITEGTFLSGGGPTFFLPGTIDNTVGAIYFTADSLQGPVGGVLGGGVLATVTFEALGAGSSPVAIQNLFLLDSSFSSIDVTAFDGAVDVSGVPEPATVGVVCLGLALLASLARGRLPGVGVGG
jgi:hypothetical protein